MRFASLGSGRNAEHAADVVAVFMRHEDRGQPLDRQPQPLQAALGLATVEAAIDQDEPARAAR